MTQKKRDGAMGYGREKEKKAQKPIEQFRNGGDAKGKKGLPLRFIIFK